MDSSSGLQFKNSWAIPMPQEINEKAPSHGRVDRTAASNSQRTENSGNRRYDSQFTWQPIIRYMTSYYHTLHSPGGW